MGKKTYRKPFFTLYWSSNSLKPKQAKRKIVAYVESYDDISFWRSLLAEYENDKRYFEVMLPSEVHLPRERNQF